MYASEGSWKSVGRMGGCVNFMVLISSQFVQEREGAKKPKFGVHTLWTPPFVTTDGAKFEKLANNLLKDPVLQGGTGREGNTT